MDTIAAEPELPVAGDTVAVFDAADGPLAVEAAVAALDRAGCIVLRNVLSAAKLAELVRRADGVLARPAIAGTVGYAKIDHPKKLANPFLLRRPFVELALDAGVIEIIERYQGSETILAEANLKYDAPVGYPYFPMHADFAAGWRKSDKSPISLTAEDIRNRVGVGGVFYLHDTAEGAFSYCLGTHTLLAPRGQSLSAYPPDEKQRILARRKRIDGKAGDLVLFDDRGFHGPDQPSSVPRTVILLDYYRVATFGRTQVAPMLAYPADLGGLVARQLRVLGIGAAEMVPPEEYLTTRFKRSPGFRRAQRAVDTAWRNVHLRQQIKKLLGKRLMRWLGRGDTRAGTNDV